MSDEERERNELSDAIRGAADVPMIAMDGSRITLSRLVKKSHLLICFEAITGESGQQRIRAIRDNLKFFYSLNLSVIVITGSKADENRTFARSNNIGFPLLEDPGFELARRLYPVVAIRQSHSANISETGESGPSMIMKSSMMLLRRGGEFLEWFGSEESSNRNTDLRRVQKAAFTHLKN